jgi:hypothetical protein
MQPQGVYPIRSTPSSRASCIALTCSRNIRCDRYHECCHLLLLCLRAQSVFNHHQGNLVTVVKFIQIVS